MTDISSNQETHLLSSKACHRYKLVGLLMKPQVIISHLSRETPFS